MMPHKNSKLSNAGQTAILSVTIIALMFSPMLAWLFAFLALSMGTATLTAESRKLYSVIAAFASALIAGSRQVFISPSDDFKSYYSLYLQFFHNNFSNFFEYHHIEIAYPVLIFLVSRLPLLFSPNLLIFFLVFFSYIIFIIWIESYGLNHIDEEKKALVVAFSLLFVNFVIASQLVRQFISSMFLLFAFSIPNIKRYIYLIIAALFHLSALPIYLLYLFSVKKPKLSAIIVFIAAFVFVMNFQYFINLFIGIKMPIFGAGYYIAHKQYGFLSYYHNIKRTAMMILLLVLFLFFGKNASARQWKYFTFNMIILYFLFYTIPLASLRTTLIIISILIGYLISMIILPKFPKLIFYFFIAAIIFRLYEITIISPHSANGFALWKAYGFLGKYPFYYFGDKLKIL